MIAPIEEAGLKLLAYLSEHAGGYHERIWLDPKAAIRSLRISSAQFTNDSLGLVALGLAGVRKLHSDTESAAPSQCSAIWLTGKGEDYMRALRAALEAGPKLTGGAVKGLWTKGNEAVVGTARLLLAEINQHTGQPAIGSRIATRNIVVR